MFCFTFVSDHNTDYIMLYSVQLKNMYSYSSGQLSVQTLLNLVSTILLVTTTFLSTVNQLKFILAIIQTQSCQSYLDE